MLQELQLVSREAFGERLRELIISTQRTGGAPVGLYAERELRHRFGVPHRLFKEKGRKHKRAVGGGPQPVRPTKAYDPRVGSEGIVAQLVSELCREHPTKFYSHPGPDTIRAKNIRRFLLVTDFIGSGTRAWRYLEAAWRVKSAYATAHLLSTETRAGRTCAKTKIQFHSWNETPSIWPRDVRWPN
jgi:hypothetical protein